MSRPSTSTRKATWCWRWIKWASSRRLESLVDLDLVAGGVAIGFIRHADHPHQLSEHAVAHPRLARGGGMGSDAVSALVADADGDVDHLLGQCVQRARRHDLLDAEPGAAQRGRIVGDRLPK